MKTKRIYFKSVPTGNSQYFRMFLDQLRANNPGKKLILILDNSSIHISKKIKEYLKRVKDIMLFFLPKYSPHYNPIERFWLWLKQKVYGFRSFDDIEEIISVVRKYIWNYNEGRLKSAINFKIKIYQDLL